MTEAEWMVSADPAMMLESVRDRISERKLRLFAVACVRRQWPLLGQDTGRRIVEQVEAYADGKGPRPKVAVGGTGPDPQETAELAARFTATAVAVAAAGGASSEAADAVAELVIQAARSAGGEGLAGGGLIAGHHAGGQGPEPPPPPLP